MTGAERVSKTNAMRLLESRGAPYEAHSYDPSILTGTGVAEVLGVPAGSIVKTLVARRDSGHVVLVMSPSDRAVDLRALATALGAKKIAMVSKADAERLTGLQVGGIGALALMDRGFHIVLLRSAMRWEHVYVNGGRRGLNLRLSVRDLVTSTGARIVSIAWPALAVGSHAGRVF